MTLALTTGGDEIDGLDHLAVPEITRDNAGAFRNALIVALNEGTISETLRHYKFPVIALGMIFGLSETKTHQALNDGVFLRDLRRRGRPA